ncbi:MAG: 50S ribosome-binding GTPase [Candidatus Heimdallarchaeota archaeon]|nr:50S ribosome-binding GTPase [Candidatus Heimdallarchaeota archaeon]
MAIPLVAALKWLDFLNRKKKLCVGIFGETNVGKSTLANRITCDFTGEKMSIASSVPHETREIQQEYFDLQANGKTLGITLLDMPGISTKVDFREFKQYGLTEEEAMQRAKEATRGVIDAIKAINNIDLALLMVDSTRAPFSQVNITVLGVLEKEDVPTIVVANKIDEKGANPEQVEDAFTGKKTVPISALNGTNMSMLYKTIASS